KPPLIISNMIGGEWFGHYFEQQTPFPGIGHVEMAWDKLVAAQLQGQVNLTQNNIVLLCLAAGQNADELKELLDYRTMLGASASYYYNTMFGPLGATLSYCNLTKKPLFFVNLGFVF
ncbi:MAG: patatin, partial [Prevotella sp.]|nr:patatin [Prevotella sp.]